MKGATFFRIALGIFQWSLAIVSVLGTLALAGWILMMFFKKERKP